MAENARRKVVESSKKRKGDKDGKGSSKKAKGIDGEANLKKAQDKHHASVKVGGSKPIFIQPPTLNADCELKDYQLEGIRWLASLYGRSLCFSSSLSYHFNSTNRNLNVIFTRKWCLGYLG
jgi:SNF2 family DNA or RNA helicase